MISPMIPIFLSKILILIPCATNQDEVRFGCFFTAEADKEYSRCNKCNTRLKMHSGTTSILFRHLKGFHPKRYRKFMDIRVARGEIPEWKDTDRSKDESPKKRTKGSPIWNFFTENANESATCNICLQCMSIRHKSTTHLNRHLKSYHP